MSVPRGRNNRATGGSGKRPKGKREEDVSGGRVTRYAAGTAIVVAVLFAVALLLNSGFVRRDMAAVTVDGVKYGVVDVNYYFQMGYTQYYQAMSSLGEMAESMLPNPRASFKSQIYDEETGESWSDFLRGLALEQLRVDNKIYLAAVEAGYALDDETRQRLEGELGSMDMMAEMYGYPNLKAYLAEVYGKGMTESHYRGIAERVYLIDAYKNHKRDSLVYSAEELDSYYADNRDNFDSFTYRYFMVRTETADKADYGDDAAYEEAKAAALEAAGASARAYADAIDDEESFIDAARDYDPETYVGDGDTLRVYRGDLLGSTYGPWLRDAGRAYGDVATFEAAGGHYVVQYIDRSDNHYATVNMRQIAIKPASVTVEGDAGDEQATFDAAAEAARETARQLADQINGEWQAAGATEDKLAELTQTYAGQISADESNAYENVHRSQLDGTVTDWLYDAARKADDSAVLYSEEADTYYIVHFSGAGQQYSDVLAETAKRTEDMQVWEEGLPSGEPKTSWLMILAK